MDVYIWVALGTFVALAVGGLWLITLALWHARRNVPRLPLRRGRAAPSSRRRRITITYGPGYDKDFRTWEEEL